MGLDTSHNCWHGGYGRFNHFRYALGRQIGINLDEYEGYGDKGTKDLTTIDHDLMPLFNHSDCDGVLTVEESRKIVDGLNKVLDSFREDEAAPLDFKERIVQFRDGCMDAISKNEEVDFH
jgi:hypothetical protein